MTDLEGIKDRLSYDTDTGLFHYLVAAGIKPKGSVAGHLTDSGYILITYRRKRFYAHRLAFWFITGVLPKEFADHKNGIRDDNRWSNLREATREENARNQVVKGGTSKYKGVTWHNNGWQASLNSKLSPKRYLGRFSCEEEAAQAYNKAAKEYFGEFAKLNEFT
jgi:hypothetical protein